MWPIGWGVGLDWQKRSVQNLPICSGRGMRRSARGRRWRGRSPCGTGSATWRSASSRHTREGEEHDDQQRACPRRVWALLSHARLVNLMDVMDGILTCLMLRFGSHIREDPSGQSSSGNACQHPENRFRICGRGTESRLKLQEIAVAGKTCISIFYWEWRCIIWSAHLDLSEIEGISNTLEEPKISSEMHSRSHTNAAKSR